MSIMANMSGVNLGRLFTQLVDPDKMMTASEKSLAEHCMTEISGGARHGNNPKYKHKGEGKPTAKKQKEHSGLRHHDKKRIPRPKRGAFSSKES